MKKTICALTALYLIFIFTFPCFAATVTPPDIRAAAEGIIDYKKGENENLLSGDILDAAGSTAGDWYPFGMSLFGFSDDYGAYLTALRNNVRERYEEDGSLSADKATEWHRVIIACLACGGDPQKFCVTKNGETVDLLADGVFFRKNLARQGINGYIWGLIALNTRDYPVPADALNTKESILGELLSRQLENGCWSMTGAGDVDLTAMTLFAISPLCEENAEAASAAQKALSFLSETQLENGGFAQDGVENCESCAVVVTALCSLGVDPETDARFVKNGKNPVDALLSYRLENGAFTHSFSLDENDPYAVPNEANDMSCQQALYALGALYRYRTGAPAAFDFSEAKISSEGYYDLPREPGAVENAAKNAGEKLGVFLSNPGKRSAAVSACLAAAVISLSAVFISRRRKKKKQ